MHTILQIWISFTHTRTQLKKSILTKNTDYILCNIYENSWDMYEV